MHTRHLAIVLGAFFLGACSNYVPLGPSDAASTSSSTTTTTTTGGGSTAPTTPTPPTTTAVAYTQDVAPILNRDCLSCHNDRSSAGRYSVSSYASTMKGVVAGSASSALVLTTKANGSMYRFLSGDRAGKAAVILQWVTVGAPQNR